MSASKTPENPSETRINPEKPRNKGGRPKGSRSPSTDATALAAARAKIVARASEIDRALVAALDGAKPNTALLVALLRACVAPQKETTTVASTFKIAEPTTVEQARAEIGRIAAASVAGLLSPDAARVGTAALVAWLESHAKTQLEAQLNEIERRLDVRDAQNNIRSIRS